MRVSRCRHCGHGRDDHRSFRGGLGCTLCPDCPGFYPRPPLRTMIRNLIRKARR